MNTIRVSIVAMLLLSVSCLAQTQVKIGTVEINPYGGGTFDLPGAAGYVGLVDSANAANRQEKYNQGRRSEPFAGGRISVSLTKFLWVYGDYSYLFPDRTNAAVSLFSSSGVNTTNRHYWVSEGGLQFAFPTIQRASPFVEVGMGVMHQNYTSRTAYTNLAGANPNPVFVQNDRGNITIGPHFGAGVRIFRGERDGFAFGVDGNYLFTGLPQIVPAAGAGSFPTISRRSWGRVYVGYFFRLGRK
jgi:hypothetical protein